MRRAILALTLSAVFACAHAAPASADSVEKLLAASGVEAGVNGLIAFYGSPAARKLPALQQKLASIMQAHSQKLQARLKQVVEQTLGDAKPAAK
ncbi:DUF2059 domain-containing protein [Ramlibacter humi]|uniref:DUF2059 domain-containing protein n=1 Tax=Ramlibacter humi TaxID=2530451 RepID=A0A4Z0CEC5_9BURK|nr:DUF2059 domain-containing protein [Ramlibacter humi]TFZ08978.1 hypothetical protein EZ216_07505 [Ramlibacter humi]